MSKDDDVEQAYEIAQWMVEEGVLLQQSGPLERNGRDLDEMPDTYREAVEKAERIARDEIQKVLDEEYIRGLVRQKIRDEAEDLVLSMLGFEHKFGSWEVDDRSDVSSARDFVERVAGDEIGRWLDEELGEALDGLGDEATEEAIEDAKEEYRDRLRSKVKKRVFSDVNDIASDVKEEVKQDVRREILGH